MPMILVPQQFLQQQPLRHRGGDRRGGLQFRLGAPRAQVGLCVVQEAERGLWPQRRRCVRPNMKRLSQRGLGASSPSSPSIRRGARPPCGSTIPPSSRTRRDGRGASSATCSRPGSPVPSNSSASRRGAPRKLQSAETQCAAEGHAFCLFEVTPARLIRRRFQRQRYQNAPQGAQAFAQLKTGNRQ